MICKICIRTCHIYISKGIIHLDDFEKSIFKVVGHDTLSRRDVHFINQRCIIDFKRKSIDYMKIQEILGSKKDDIFSDSNVGEIDESAKENWHGINEEETEFLKSVEQFNSQIKGSANSGSIGEFLNHASSPLEQANFLKLLQCLEVFQEETGLKLKASKDGFVVPLGQHLKASIQFHVSS